MTKHNKVRYKINVKEKKQLVFSGKIWLKHRDDVEEEIKPSVGDFLAYPYEKSLNSARVGQYWDTGFSGYFKFDVFDGFDWRLILLNEIFPENEHHFSKSECPIDTFALCEEIFAKMGNFTLERTYREHYQLPQT